MAHSSGVSTAGELLVAVVADLTARIEDGVPAALADEPDAVHRLRTAVRRLRNVLAVCKRYAQEQPLRELRDCLAELGDVLGAVRDLEVRAELAAEALGRLDLPAEVHERLVVDRLEEKRAAHGELVAYAEDRLPGVLLTLHDWAERPPLTDAAGRKAAKAATKALRRQARRTVDAMRVDVGLLRERADADELARAHELRKAARRLRHAGEAFTDGPGALLGDDAVRLAAAAEGVQALLGEHRDALLLAADAHRLAERAGGEGRPRAPYDAVALNAVHRAGPLLGGLPEKEAALREATVDFGG